MKHVETKITSGLDFHEREFRITSFFLGGGVIFTFCCSIAKHIYSACARA